MNIMQDSKLCIIISTSIHCFVTVHKISEMNAYMVFQFQHLSRLHTLNLKICINNKNKKMFYKISTVNFENRKY